MPRRPWPTLFVFGLYRGARERRMRTPTFFVRPYRIAKASGRYRSGHRPVECRTPVSQPRYRKCCTTAASCDKTPAATTTAAARAMIASLVSRNGILSSANPQRSQYGMISPPVGRRTAIWKQLPANVNNCGSSASASNAAGSPSSSKERFVKRHRRLRPVRQQVIEPRERHVYAPYWSSTLPLSRKGPAERRSRP